MPNSSNFSQLVDPQRRQLLKLGALSAGAAISGVPNLEALEPDPAVNQVLLVTLCHLDVGFSQTQAKVLRKYFDVYYPEAMQVAARMRASGKDRYCWTTAAWLLYSYLEQASPGQRKAAEAAIEAGDLTWHAMPFNWETEMLDRSMIEGAMSFSSTLDSRFARKTIGGKMTDVPGHSRGLIAPVEAAGLKLLDIGVNAASTPPNVPDLFLWKDPGGHSLAMMYHRKDYGGIVRIPGTSVAVDIEVRNDNSGPHTPTEIAAMYAKLRGMFPQAEVKASNLSEVAAAIEPVRNQLPVVTQEIGDTWIYGVASDPDKVSRYRELSRLRRDWIEQGKFSSGDKTDRDLLQSLSLAAEHTWGTDTKSYLDYQHYRPNDLAAVLGTGGYLVMEQSWQEKRQDVTVSLDALPHDLREEAAARLSALKAKKPDSAGMKPYSPSDLLQTKHYVVELDGNTGAIVRLQNRQTGREWASPSKPLALFTYQTLSAADYSNYRGRYIRLKADWAAKDFGKPGIENFNALSKEWHPTLKQAWIVSSEDQHRILLSMHINDPNAEKMGNVAWPKEIYLDLVFPATESRIDLEISTFDKAANRLPEAMWLTFAPIAEDHHGWSVEKVGQPVDVFDVVEGGGRAMHAVTDTIRYQDARGTFEVNTRDAPLVALGQRSPLNFTREYPDLSLGTHFSLFNNGWGTNYIQWATGDWSYRFTLRA